LRNELLYLAEVFVVPFTTFSLNIYIRRLLKLPISVGADWALLLVTVDAVMVLSAEEAAKYARLSFMHENDHIATGIFLFLFLFGIAIYFGNLIAVERPLEKARRKGEKLELMPLILLLAGALVYTYAHLRLFLPFP
jgi:hypothetical protein